MVYERLKVYVPYLYKANKVRGAYTIVPKGTLCFKYISKKQTKTNEERWDKRKKSLKLYNNKYAFCLFLSGAPTSISLFLSVCPSVCPSITNNISETVHHLIIFSGALMISPGIFSF